MKYINTIPGPGQYNALTTINKDGKNVVSNFGSAIPIAETKAPRFSDRI